MAAWRHGACLVPATRAQVRDGAGLGPWLAEDDEQIKLGGRRIELGEVDAALQEYAEWLWSEHAGGRTAAAHAAAAHHVLAELPQDLRPADPGRQLMFDDRLYQRGGLTVHALRCALGEDAFFRMLKDWTGRHRHGAVSTADFTAPAQRYAAALDELFDAWLREPSLPPLPPQPTAPHHPADLPANPLPQD